jgi:hypothetical protein
MFTTNPTHIYTHTHTHTQCPGINPGLHDVRQLMTNNSAQTDRHSLTYAIKVLQFHTSLSLPKCMPNFFLKERQHTEMTVVERILLDNNTDSGVVMLWPVRF